MNSRERIELFLCNIKENTVIEASRIYTFLADDMTEAAFYKTLERFCQSGSLVHLTKGLYYNLSYTHHHRPAHARRQHPRHPALIRPHTHFL